MSCKIQYSLRFTDTQKGGALIGRRVLNRGGALIKFFFMIVQVTGPRRLEHALVVPGKFKASTKSTAIGQKLKEDMMHINELSLLFKKVRG